MAKREKTDYCDACFEPWYPRNFDADGEPMENICDDCAELVDEDHPGLREEDEQPPICACGVTMLSEEDDEGTVAYYCGNENCRYFEVRQQ